MGLCWLRISANDPANGLMVLWGFLFLTDLVTAAVLVFALWK